MPMLRVTIAEDLTNAHVKPDTLEMAKNADLVIIQRLYIFIYLETYIYIGGSLLIHDEEKSPQSIKRFSKLYLVSWIQNFGRCNAFSELTSALT